MSNADVSYACAVGLGSHIEVYSAWAVRHPKCRATLQRVRDGRSIKISTLSIGGGRVLHFRVRNVAGLPVLRVRAWIVSPNGHERMDGKRAYMSVPAAEAWQVEIVELSGGMARIAYDGRHIKFPAVYIHDVRRAFSEAVQAVCWQGAR